MLESLFVLTALLMCVYACLWAYTRRARKLTAALSTLPELPFFGNLLRFIGDGKHIYNCLVELSDIIEKERKPVIFWMGPVNPVIMMSDPDDVKAVTNAFIEKPYMYNFGRIWLGNGLVTAPGPIWKRNIKRLAGTFTGSIVNGYQDVFNAQAHLLLNQLKGEVGKEPFDAMEKYLAYTTLEAICQTALGVSHVSESIVTEEYYHAFSRTLELLLQRGVNALIHPEFVYRLTPAYKEMTKCVSVLHGVSEKIIIKRKQEMEERKKNGCIEQSTPENGKRRFRAFFEILMELRDIDPSLSEEQIKAEVDTIIVGGQETVATTLLFTLLMLGSQPQVQQRVYEEVIEIFGDSKRPVENDDLIRMKYCEAVINETLRLYPAVPAVMRYADHDLQLESCVVPKGAACCINVLGAGRSKRWWGPDALEFRPERWLDLPHGQPPSFYAFSYGKRACIGKRYAMAILKTIIAHCIRELEFVSEADKIEFKMDIALKPVAGHFMSVRLR